MIQKLFLQACIYIHVKVFTLSILPEFLPLGRHFLPPLTRTGDNQTLLSTAHGQAIGYNPKQVKPNIEGVGVICAISAESKISVLF